MESWGSIPAGGIPWSITAGPVNTRVAPGMPPVGCHISLPAAQRPALQSAIRAAKAWTAEVPIAPVPGSGPVLTPYPIPKATTFKMAAVPSYLGWSNWMENDMDRMVRDGTNLVTFYQSDWWWQFMGGPTALGAAFVYLSTDPAMPAEIVEADIAVNCRSEPVVFSGQPSYSMIEFNDADQRYYATHTFDSFVQAYPDPVFGYVDLQGLLTHEFGHVAGVAHSAVDSNQQGGLSRTPTMFPYAQVEDWSGTLHFSEAPSYCSNYVPYSANGANTLFGGLLGKSARTLELDDIAAISEIYPAPSLSQFAGSISGTCYLGSLNNPIAGAHIVAERIDDVDRLRVGTYSRAGGAFTVRGLPPGDYRVYAEPVDQPPSPTSTIPGYYFDSFSVATEVFLGSFTLPSGLLASGCISSQPVFVTEYHDANESFGELKPMTTSLITVTAGNDVGGIDFHLENGIDLLTLGVATTGQSHDSPRGFIVAPNGGTFPTVDCKINAGSAYANGLGWYVVNRSRSHTLYQGQTLAIDLSSPIIIGVPLDGNGSATLPITTNPNLAFNNFFIQAAVAGSDGIRLSNQTVLWVASL